MLIENHVVVVVNILFQIKKDTLMTGNYVFNNRIDLDNHVLGAPRMFCGTPTAFIRGTCVFSRGTSMTPPHSERSRARQCNIEQIKVVCRARGLLVVVLNAGGLD